MEHITAQEAHKIAEKKLPSRNEDAVYYIIKAAAEYQVYNVNFWINPEEPAENITKIKKELVANGYRVSDIGTMNMGRVIQISW